MIRSAAAALLATALIVPAHAQPRVVQPEVPQIQMQVLGQMLNECGGREATALVRAAMAEQELAKLQQQLAAQTKRADEAEAKLKGPDQPAAEPAEPAK